MKKYKMSLPVEFLDGIKEFDRTKEKIDGWGYTSGNTIENLERERHKKRQRDFKTR